MINQTSIRSTLERGSIISECYLEADVPLSSRSVCQATAHMCRSFHEPITSPPRSLVVSYHLPFNLKENMSLRCAVVCVSLFLFFFVEFVFGGHFSCIDDRVRPSRSYVDCHNHGHLLVKCEVQLLLVSISS